MSIHQIKYFDLILLAVVYLQRLFSTGMLDKNGVFYRQPSIRSPLASEKRKRKNTPSLLVLEFTMSANQKNDKVTCDIWLFREKGKFLGVTPTTESGRAKERERESFHM